MWIFCLGILLTGGEKAQAAGKENVTEVNIENKNAKQYTVRFREYNMQKHLIVWNHIAKVTYGKTYGKAIWKPKKTGYTFVGWYSAPSGGKKLQAVPR